MTIRISRYSALVICNVLLLCVLGFYRSGSAQPKPQPHSGLSNPAERQVEMIEQLKELNRLVAEQNNLLRSGQLKVVVVDEGK